MKLPKTFLEKIKKRKKELDNTLSKRKKELGEIGRRFDIEKGGDLSNLYIHKAWVIKKLEEKMPSEKKSFDTLLKKLEITKKEKDANQAYERYIKNLQKLKEEPINIRIPLIGSTKGYLNRKLLKNLIGKKQQTPITCRVAIQGIASQILLNKKRRISDNRIYNNKEILEKEGKLIKPKELRKDFNSLITKLKKGGIVETLLPRSAVFPIVEVLEIKKEHTKNFGGKYFITVKTPTFSGERKDHFLMNNQKEVKKFVKRIQHIQRARTQEKSLKEYGTEVERFFASKDKIIFTAINLPRNYLSPRWNPSSAIEHVDHHAFVIGAREDKKGRRYVTIYDQNYKRAHTTPVYEIPFEFCHNLQVYQK